MFKKLLAATMVVSVAASMSVSAFAADVTVAPTDSAVTVTPTAVENATMYTVMVFNTTADITDATAVAAATPADASAIYYINQGTDATALVTDMLVKATTVDDATTYLPVGNYVVRIGNDTGSVQNITLVSEEETVTIVYGDINGDGLVKANDVVFLKRHLANWDGYSSTDINYAASDINADGSVKANDVVFLKRHLANWEGYETLPYGK